MKSAEVNVSISSSFDRFESFAVGAKTELTSRNLNNSLKIQVCGRALSIFFIRVKDFFLPFSGPKIKSLESLPIWNGASTAKC